MVMLNYMWYAVRMDWRRGAAVTAVEAFNSRKQAVGWINAKFKGAARERYGVYDAGTGWVETLGGRRVTQLPPEKLGNIDAFNGFGGYGGGRDVYRRVYLGNFGDVNPLEYHGFFVWWHPPAGVKADKRRMAKIGGELEGVKLFNWCDASGECENEERVEALDLFTSIGDLIGGSWVDLDAVADSVGMSVEELRKNPVYAWEATIGYYSEEEFLVGGFEPGRWDFQSFREAAEFLLKRGVPRKELKRYL